MLSDVTAFHGGFAGIKGRYGANSVWYFANKQLDSNFTPYDSVQCFSDGLAAVKQYVDESTGMAFIAVTGDILIKKPMS